MTMYVVMRQDAEEPRRMLRASGDYVQRASAFKRAHKLAHRWPSLAVTVWEYRGPGDSHIHCVQRGTDER